MTREELAELVGPYLNASGRQQLSEFLRGAGILRLSYSGVRDFSGLVETLMARAIEIADSAEMMQIWIGEGE